MQLGFTGAQATSILMQPEPLLRAAGVDDSPPERRLSRSLRVFACFWELYCALAQGMESPDDPREREAKATDVQRLVDVYLTSYCDVAQANTQTIYHHLLRWVACIS